jgi:hypothetical protein
VFRWLAENLEGFRDQYARAREAQADAIFDEILEIADDARNDWVDRNTDGGTIRVFDHEHVQRSRLRLDARKFVLARMAPRKYGDFKRLEHSGPDGGGPVQVAIMSHDEIVEKAIKYNVVDRLPPALREMAEKRLSRGIQPGTGDNSADEAGHMEVAREAHDAPPGPSEGGL